MLIVVASLQLALAADRPLLTADDPQPAMIGASEALDLPLWELEPTAPTHAAKPGLHVFGRDQPAACADAATDNNGIRDLVSRAEKSVARLEFEKAEQDLRAAEGALGCLRESAEASLASRLFFLRGVARQGAGDVSGARDAFARALAFTPDLPWDTRFPPDAKPAFDMATGAVAAASAGTLLFGPGADVHTTAWVDGRLRPVKDGGIELAAGVHLVQLLEPRVATFNVVVRPGATLAMIDAAAVDARFLARLDEARVQSVVTAFVDGVWPGLDAVAWAGGRAWRRVDGAWVPAAASAGDAAPPRARVTRSGVLVGAGSALLVAGAASGLASWASIAADAAPADPAAGSESTPEYEARDARVKFGNAATAAGFGVAGLGAVGLLLGLVLPDEGPVRAASAAAGEVGQVAVRW